MSKYQTLDSLLPGIGQFLLDILLIDCLPPDLEKKVKIYLNKIKEYKDPRPELPPQDLQEKRDQSWRISQTVEYQNTPDINDTYLEPNMSSPPPPPPMTNRPPIKREIDPKEMDIYENPDDGNGDSSGRGSMPSEEGSGGSFVMRQSEPECYYDSFSDSTDYESMDDDIVEDKPAAEKKKVKVKIDKLDAFRKEHASEVGVDLMDLLLYYNNFLGTMKMGNILGKWEKRYCIARDSQLFSYGSYKDKKHERLPLMGYEVYFVGQQSGQDNVFRISHGSLKHPMLFAAASKAESEKWVTVLQNYATIDHTIVPTQGKPSDSIEAETDTAATSKKGGLFRKKEKDTSQQIHIDEEDNLSGYVNLLGAHYGETKVRKKWITIRGNSFACSAGPDEPNTFSFLMAGIDVDNADKKEAKMKNAFKLSRDGTVLFYVEALNKVDAGTLLKKLVEAMSKKPEETSSSSPSSPAPSPGGREGHGSMRKSTEGIVAKLMANFESTPVDQPDAVNQKFQKPRKSLSMEEPLPLYDDVIAEPQEGFYDDVDVEAFPPPDPQKKAPPQKSFTLPMLRTGNKDLSESTAQAEKDKKLKDKKKKEKKELDKEKKKEEKRRKEEEKEEKRKREKEEREEKKRREKEEREEKKRREEEEKREREAAAAAAREAEESAVSPPSLPSSPSTPSPAPSPSTNKKEDPLKKEEGKKSPVLQRRTTAAALKLGDQSGTSHLIRKDQLMQDRKDLEAKRTAANKRRTDLRSEMNSATDPVAKDKLKAELDTAQKEWSVLNKKLVEISRQIEDATLGKDANDNKTSTRPTPRAVSPDREKVSSGTVMDRMKMFQGN